MATKDIPLLSPENAEIIGILLEDGSLCAVSFTYDKEMMQSVVMLKGNPTTKPTQENGETVYVDANGQKWAASDVEYHSIIKSPY